MGRKLEDLTNQVFGDVRVVRLHPDGGSKKGKTAWICRCQSGHEIKILRARLKSRLPVICPGCARYRTKPCRTCGKEFYGYTSHIYCRPKCWPSAKRKDPIYADPKRHAEIVRLRLQGKKYLEIAAIVGVTRDYAGTIFRRVSAGQKTLVNSPRIDFARIKRTTAPAPKDTQPRSRKSRADDYVPRVFTTGRFR